MYISIEQVEASLARLTPLNPFFGISFLAFKRVDLPVGTVRELVFSNVIEELLEEYYRVTDTFDGFYQPYSTSHNWVSPRYGSTSLQRTTVDAFGDTLIHTKNSSEWGWRRDYVSRLKRHLHGERVPAFDLAVWLYRTRRWPAKVRAEEVGDAFLSDFKISREERQELFDPAIPKLAVPWVREQEISQSALLDLLGAPPGQLPPEGSALKLLEFVEVGPAHVFRYEPSERLNIITGDNSLGKTFLLESIWWALTWEWLGVPAQPRYDVPKSKPRISFALASASGRSKEVRASYDWARQDWTFRRPSPLLPPALVVYARFDGSFAISDPARRYSAGPNASLLGHNHLLFSRNDIWDGLKGAGSGDANVPICNGLIYDWVLWQNGGERYEPQFSALTASLAVLSPSDDEPLTPGEPRRLGLSAREIPTMAMPYGDVPILYASAGVQRVVALAYMLVWTWHEHLTFSAVIRRQPQRRLVLVMDEVEAHLHPKWQRTIVPALMRVIEALSTKITPQIHLATHSPMVMASAETVFDEERDDLHHLKLLGDEVVLEELTFAKMGRADAWLTSEVFGLAQARSLPAERAIERAKGLQLKPSPSPREIADVDAELALHLAADDAFWPRWRYFAEKHGAPV